MQLTNLQIEMVISLMSSKHFCDLCNKEIKDFKGFTIWRHPNKEYCEKCWYDKKKWPQIHSKEEEEN